MVLLAYAGGPIGAYSESRVFPAERLVPLPKDLDDKIAAAVMQSRTNRAAIAIPELDFLFLHVMVVDVR